MELRPTVTPVGLSGLAALAEARFVGSPVGVEVAGVSVDSRVVEQGDLFVALSGEVTHGATFVQQAASAGAVACLTDDAGCEAAEAAGLVTAVLANPRAALGMVAAEIYGHPANDLLLFGVTGTNGKTTTSWLIESGLRAAGHVTGLVGTIEVQIAGEPAATARTTPEASELQALLAVMRNAASLR